MKLKEVRIRNYRRFSDVTIPLADYTCFVGENGVGKSTVLAALNIFFCERTHSTTDTATLAAEDFHNGNTSEPIEITVTFTAISPEEEHSLSDYVRSGELIVTATARFDAATRTARVRHFGTRMGLKAFASFFEAATSNQPKKQLQLIYDDLRTNYPALSAYASKDKAVAQLREYELDHADECEELQSDDDFYGFAGTSKLNPFITWVYVPAVKDASEEERGHRDTLLGKLIERRSTGREALEDELARIKAAATDDYRNALEKHQTALTDIASSLQNRLQQWSHSLANVSLEWLSEPNKEVTLYSPHATLSAGDGDYTCRLSRLGHGLQRSYLLALLHELSSSSNPGGSRLILACEEPELFQHPPRARDLFDAMVDLSTKGDQVLVTTHSPIFVHGSSFEDVRLVRSNIGRRRSEVFHLDMKNVVENIRRARQDDAALPPQGLAAKIQQSLQPHMAEMLFCRIPVLVEGYEDAAYITAYLHAKDRWRAFRSAGCHLVPVNGKDRLVTALAIARELSISAFTVFDADGDIKGDKKRFHANDNSALIALLSSSAEPFPATTHIDRDHAIWPINIGKSIEGDYGADYERCKNAVAVRYAHEGGLSKNQFFIASLVSFAAESGLYPASLETLCDAIMAFASSCD